MIRLAVLISGRGSNMAAIVERCRAGALGEVCEVVAVVADRPDAAGLTLARAAGIPTACVPSRGEVREDFESALLATLHPFAPDLLVLAGFMRVLSPVVIARYPGRIVNIHPADPRAYRGAHGYRWAHGQGLAETHVTVHLVDEGLDTGPIIDQRVVDLRGATTLEEVERRGLAVEHAFYADVLERIGETGIDADPYWLDQLWAARGSGS